jgi:hypothetical protein
VSDEEFFEREAFLGPDGGWVGERPENTTEETDRMSVVDNHSSKTSTTDKAPSTADTPSTTDIPSTGDKEPPPPSPTDRVVSTWDVMIFAYRHGCEGRLSKSEFVTWKLRLEIESERKRPYKVAAGRLPDDVHPIVRTSFEGFVYLLQCRWNHTPNEPAPWTHEFAARWCGITERQAKDARRQLVELTALVHVGYSDRAKLWLPQGIVTEKRAA